MNDITALALLVSKAKASVFTMEYISQFEASDIDSDDVDLRFEVDGVETGTNVSIVDECGQAAQMIRALVEALEKAQQDSDGVAGMAEHYETTISMLRGRITELEESHAQVIQSRDHYKHMTEEGLKQLAESRTVTAAHSDYFASLVAMARVSADKAMRKFPQPNYVLLKVAEEAGEVVQAGVHYAEKRMEWEQVEGEIIQLLAMLIRLVTEGDQINGITPPAAGIQVIEGEGQCGGEL
ncbi:hypothetical protein [Kluyvera ascorbata]